MSCKSGNDGTIVFSGNILLAKDYLKKTGEPTVNPIGWWASEKYDGYRAIWNGNDFVSRNGNIFHAPTTFKQCFPSGVGLGPAATIGSPSFE